MSSIPGLQLVGRAWAAPTFGFFAVLMAGLASLLLHYNVLQVIERHLFVGELVARCPTFFGGKTLAAES